MSTPETLASVTAKMITVIDGCVHDIQWEGRQHCGVCGKCSRVIAHPKERCFYLEDVLIVLMLSGCCFSLNHRFHLQAHPKSWTPSTGMANSNVKWEYRKPLSEQSPELLSFLDSLL